MYEIKRYISNHDELHEKTFYRLNWRMFFMRCYDTGGVNYIPRYPELGEEIPGINERICIETYDDIIQLVDEQFI